MSEQLETTAFLLGSAQIELLIERQRVHAGIRPISEYVRTSKFDVYVRVGPLCFVAGERRTALVISRIEVVTEQQGQGVFDALVKMFEELAERYGIEYVMVECVSHDWLTEWLLRKGFIIHNPQDEGFPTLRKPVGSTSTKSEG